MGKKIRHLIVGAGTARAANITLPPHSFSRHLLGWKKMRLLMISLHVHLNHDLLTTCGGGFEMDGWMNG
jgi:hypothetical protein